MYITDYVILAYGDGSTTRGTKLAIAENSLSDMETINFKSTAVQKFSRRETLNKTIRYIGVTTPNPGGELKFANLSVYTFPRETNLEVFAGKNFYDAETSSKKITI